MYPKVPLSISNTLILCRLISLQKNGTNAPG